MILCLEDPYLLELTRYIHLNPLRACLVNDSSALDRFPYSGHGVLMGKRQHKWQEVDYILSLFGSVRKTAQKQYHAFVEKGIAQGRRPELTDGGLIRSVGGWKTAKLIFKGQQRLKGDERILGDSDFVNYVLSECEEQYERKYRLLYHCRVANIKGHSYRLRKHSFSKSALGKHPATEVQAKKEQN